MIKAKIENNKFGTYCVPDSAIKRPAADLIRGGDVYEPDTIEFMIENCGLGDIVHAGTFFGDFLPALSNALDDSCLLWAFEPNKESYICASVTCLLNELNNVKLMKAGLGSESNISNIMVKNRKGVSLAGGSKIVEAVDENMKGEFESVDIVSIDEIVDIERNISILQLDVEGYEENALKGALKVINKWKPIIILENNPSETFMEENIFNLGYKFEMKLHHNTVYSI